MIDLDDLTHIGRYHEGGDFTPSPAERWMLFRHRIPVTDGTVATLRLVVDSLEDERSSWLEEGRRQGAESAEEGLYLASYDEGYADGKRDCEGRQ